MPYNNTLHSNHQMTRMQQGQLFKLGKAFRREWYKALELDENESEEYISELFWSPWAIQETLKDHSNTLSLDTSKTPVPSYEGDKIVDRWPDLAMVTRIACDGRTTISFLEDTNRSRVGFARIFSSADSQVLICTVKIDPTMAKPVMNIMFANANAQMPVVALPLMLQILDTFDPSQTIEIARNYLPRFQAPLRGNENGTSTKDLAGEPLRGFHRYIVVQRTAIIDLLQCSCIDEARHYVGKSDTVYRIVVPILD